MTSWTFRTITRRVKVQSLGEHKQTYSGDHSKNAVYTIYNILANTVKTTQRTVISYAYVFYLWSDCLCFVWWCCVWDSRNDSRLVVATSRIANEKKWFHVIRMCGCSGRCLFLFSIYVWCAIRHAVKMQWAKLHVGHLSQQCDSLSIFLYLAAAAAAWVGLTRQILIVHSQCSVVYLIAFGFVS